MSINSNPIVLKDTNGNLKEASQTDLEYMAFQAGLRISSDVSSVQPYALNTDGTVDDKLIGSFVNTFYNQPVGTHPASSLSQGSTTTFLYQREPSQVFTDELSTFRRPVTDSDSGTSIIDMNDASMTTLSRELMQILQGDEMPGSFRLASTAPSADWSASLSNVFEDTNTDGNVTSYTIWQRTSGTMPTSCSPMYVKRDQYGSRPLGTYDGGLQAMSQEQVSVTFGQILRKHFAEGEVGTYQLRSSAQGAPTDTGTWEARGTAVDTRYITQSQQYTGQYTGFSLVQYSGDRSFTGVFTSAPIEFAGFRQFSGPRSYTGQYVSPPIQFAGERFFSGDRNYGGNYTSNPTQFAGVRTFSGQRTFALAGGYVSNPTNFAGVRSFSGSRPYSKQYVSPPANFAGTRQFSGNRTFALAGGYTSPPIQFAGVRYFSGNRGFSGQYTTPAVNFAGFRQYAGFRQKFRPAVLYQNFAGQRATTYSRGVSYYRGTNVTQQFTGTREYAGVAQNFRPGTIQQNFVGARNYNGPMPYQFGGVLYTNFVGSGPAPGTVLGPFPFGGGQQFANFSSTYFINPNPFIPGNVLVVPFSGVRVGVGYSGSRVIYFTGFRNNVQYAGSRRTQFSGVRIWQFSGPRAFLGPRPVNYSSPYPTNFTGCFGCRWSGPRPVQYLGYTTIYRPGVLYQQFAGVRYVAYAGYQQGSFARPQQFNGTRQSAGVRYKPSGFSRPQQFTGTVTYSGSRVTGSQFTRPQQFTGTRQFAGVRYNPQPAGFSRPQQFAGTRSYSGSRVRGEDFTRPQQFTGTRQFVGSRNYTSVSGQYAGGGQFAGPTQYSGVRYYTSAHPKPQQFTGTRDYSGPRTYTGQYSRSYSNQYTGQYAGDTLIDTSEVIETFTLYVRVS